MSSPSPNKKPRRSPRAGLQETVTKMAPTMEQELQSTKASLLQVNLFKEGQKTQLEFLLDILRYPLFALAHFMGLLAVTQALFHVMRPRLAGPGEAVSPRLVWLMEWVCANSELGLTWESLNDGFCEAYPQYYEEGDSRRVLPHEGPLEGPLAIFSPTDFVLMAVTERAPALTPHGATVAFDRLEGWILEMKSQHELATGETLTDEDARAWALGALIVMGEKDRDPQFDTGFNGSPA